MTIASIMVHVDVDAASEERVAAAADLATRFDALLIGVAGWPLRQSGGLEQSATEYPPQEQALQARVIEQLDLLGEKFRRLAGANPRGVEWRASYHVPSEFIAAQARSADLVVVGGEPLPGDVYHTFDPGSVILACGRPVLVVPRSFRRVHASRVLIAWKDTREARRAVRDSLPFLKEAESVVIATVDAPDVLDRAREQIGDVARYLEHHRIAGVRQIAAPANDAESRVLLRIAEQEKVDFIVAGAYGRSRISEWIFGGVTRQLLAESKRPCFFSN